MYKGVKSEILYTTLFVEHSDLGATYLGKENMNRPDKIKTGKETCPISEKG